MTFDQLFKKVAAEEGVSFRQAKLIIECAARVTKEEVLNGSGRVLWPQFGVFDRRVTKEHKRSIGGVMRTVPAKSRVIFRVSVGAKRSE